MSRRAQVPAAPRDGATLLTPEEAAYLLGRSVATLARWRVTGEGPAFVRPKPRLVRYRRDDIDAFFGAPIRSTTEADARDAYRVGALAERHIERVDVVPMPRREEVVLCGHGGASVFVYGLHASDEPARIRYVGITHAPWVRYKEHLASDQPKMREWVKGVLARGSKVIMVQLAREPKRTGALAAEQRLIAEYRALGMADVNDTPWRGVEVRA